MSDIQGKITGYWTFQGVPEIGDGKDGQKNISLLGWFQRKYRYTDAELAQIMGVSLRSIYRYRARQSLPKRQALQLMALAGLRVAGRARWWRPGAGVR